MERIITIGREYGSGGREIGRRLAEKLQFAFFDYQIVTELAKRTAFAEEYILSIRKSARIPCSPFPPSACGRRRTRCWISILRFF